MNLKMQLAAPLSSRRLRNYLLAPEIVKSSRVSDALNCVQERWPACNDGVTETESSPVFIFSAGWGSGSTLLQRLVMSSREVLVWGEPMDQSATIQRLAMTLTPVRENWPPEYHLTDERDFEKLSQDWVANFTPPIEQFRLAHRNFVESWLCPGVADPTVRFGVKEVRLTIDHARYLKWLFPNAKFLFVYRDLFASYLSCRRQNWFSVWPDYKATPILSFAHHWNYLLSGYIEGAESVSGRLVKYEDLISGKFDFDSLCRYLEISSMDSAVMNRKLGTRSKRKRPLIAPEKWILNSVAGDLRKSLGYE